MSDNDDNEDEFTRRRKEREARKRKPPSSPRSLLGIDIGDELLEALADLTDDAAHTYLDYEDRVAEIERRLREGFSGFLVEAGAPIDAETVEPLIKGMVDTMISTRIDELREPQLRLLVIPLDGDAPDETHTGLLDEFGQALYNAPSTKAELLVRLQTKLREAERPAVVYAMNDSFVQEFYFESDDDGPAS